MTTAEAVAEGHVAIDDRASAAVLDAGTVNELLEDAVERAKGYAVEASEELQRSLGARGERVPRALSAPRALDSRTGDFVARAPEQFAARLGRLQDACSAAWAWCHATPEWREADSRLRNGRTVTPNFFLAQDPLVLGARHKVDVAGTTLRDANRARREHEQRPEWLRAALNVVGTQRNLEWRCDEAWEAHARARAEYANIERDRYEACAAQSRAENERAAAEHRADTARKEIIERPARAALLELAAAVELAAHRAPAHPFDRVEPGAILTYAGSEKRLGVELAAFRGPRGERVLADAAGLPLFGGAGALRPGDQIRVRDGQGGRAQFAVLERAQAAPELSHSHSAASRGGHGR